VTSLAAAAVILNIKSFGLAVILLLALTMAVAAFYRHPTRRCHRCQKPVRLTQRVCANCGYDFEPVRTSR
jgi:predicted amidophosphoribosyltransferase